MGYGTPARPEAAVAFEPLTVRISTAVQLTGISRSRLYELIQSGDLETVKVGRSTLIPYKNLKALTRT
jgi:excisionase family DNA binding protein